MNELKGRYLTSAGLAAMLALVVNSTGNGGPTCGPIVAKFLSGL